MITALCYLHEALIEGQLTDHLVYEPNDPRGNVSGNSRNGRSVKKVQSKDGEMALEVRQRWSRYGPLRRRCCPVRDVVGAESRVPHT